MGLGDDNRRGIFVRIRPDDKDFPKQVETSAKQAAQKGSAVATKELSSGFKRAGRESHTSFLSAFTHFGDEIKHRFFAGLQFGVGAFTGIQAFSALEKVFGEGFQSEKLFQASTAQLNQVLKTTHGVAGESADSVNALSEKIAGYSGETVNALRNSQVMLLGFTNIRDVVGKNNDIFGRASVAAEDLSKRYGLDVSTSARTLGRALNDPVRGLLTLRRAGVSFTSQLSDQVKKLAAHGKILEAQKLILRAVEQRVGGAANAYGKTLPGQVDRAREKFNEFSRHLTEKLLPALTRVGSNLLDFATRIGPDVSKAFTFLGAVLSTTVGIFGRVVSAIRSTVNWARQNKALLLPLAAGFGAVAAAVLLYAGVTKAAAIAEAVFTGVTNGLRGAMLLLNLVLDANPFFAVATLVVGLAAAFVTAWKTSVTFRDGVKTAFRDIEHAVGVAISAIITAFRWWVDAQLKVFSVIAHGAAAALGWVPGLGSKLRAAVTQFDNFRVGVDGTLRGLADDAYALGQGAGKNWLDGWTHGSARQPKPRVVNGKLTYPVGFIGPIPKGAQIGPIAPQPGTPGVHDTAAAAPPTVKIPTTSFAAPPDFTPGSTAAKNNAAAKNKAAATAKEIVAKAVPVGLTSAAVIKAIGDAVAKGRPGVLAELTKLASQIRVTLNAPAAHGARDQIIEVLNKRRAALGKLADQYVTITKKIDAATQKLTDAQQAQADFFSSLKDTFTSAGALVNVLSGLSDQVSPGGAAVGGFLQAQVNSLNAFLDNLDKLKQEGLSPDLIKQLATAGPDQGGRIAAGLTGASQAQIQRINDLEAQLQSRAASGAQQLTNDFYQAGIDQLKTELANDRKELGKISAAINNMEKKIGDDVGRGVAAGLHATAATANAKARAKTRQASAGHKAR